MKTIRRGAFRRARRRVMFYLLLAAAWLAAWIGPGAVRAVGAALGRLSAALARLDQPGLADDIARALDCPPGRGREILGQARRFNERAVLEILALSAPGRDPGPFIDRCRIDHTEDLEALVRAGRGAILLGMHMGNGILMAARLGRMGFPVSVVYRESRKIPPGHLGRTLERAGLGPIHLEKRNPGPGNRRLLKALRAGRLVYVLMDQGARGEGVALNFLGKPVRMPRGIVRLALKLEVPVVPILPEAAEPEWRFRVMAPVRLPEDEDAAVAALAGLMERHIRARPELWTWHHRRWRRYPFDSGQARSNP